MLNHWAVVGLSSFGETPGTTLGRSILVLLLVWFTPSRMVTGKPLDFVTMEFNCQPPSSVEAIPWLRNCLPLPTGSSYSSEATKRCRVSKSDKPYSHRRHHPFCGCLGAT